MGTIHITYENMQELRNKAFAKGKDKASRQKAFEVLKATFLKGEVAKVNSETVIDVIAT